MTAYLFTAVAEGRLSPTSAWCFGLAQQEEEQEEFYSGVNLAWAVYPSLISLMVSVDVKHHVYLLTLVWAVLLSCYACSMLFFACYACSMLFFACYACSILFLECYACSMLFFECYACSMLFFECYACSILLFACYACSMLFFACYACSMLFFEG